MKSFALSIECCRASDICYDWHNPRRSYKNQIRYIRYRAKGVVSVINIRSSGFCVSGEAAASNLVITVGVLKSIGATLRIVINSPNISDVWITPIPNGYLKTGVIDGLQPELRRRSSENKGAEPQPFARCRGLGEKRHDERERSTIRVVDFQRNADVPFRMCRGSVWC